LRQPAHADVADHRDRQREPGAVPGLGQQVRVGQGDRPAGRLGRRRQADRRADSQRHRRPGAVISPTAPTLAARATPRRRDERPAATPERIRARRRAAWRRRRTVLLFMSPWIVGFGVFFGYPLIANVYLSFTHYDLIGSPRWIGTANYEFLFNGD